MALTSATNLVDPMLIPNEAGPPAELLRRWREEEPVHWNPAPQNYEAPRPGYEVTQGFWVLTRYADVRDASQDQELFSSHTGGPLLWDFPPQRLADHQAGLMGMAPEHHAQIKRLVLPTFAVKVIREFEPEIAQVSRGIIDSIAKRGECEFVFDVASRLPVYTFCVLMGIPEEDREMIFHLGNSVADVEGHLPTDTREPTAALFAYASKLAEEKRKNPDKSMMSALVHGEIDGDKLTHAQIAMFFYTLAVAGHETTRSTAAHFIRLMNEYPDQYEIVKSDPGKFLLNAIDEVLRFSPPVIQFRRTATRDTQIGEQAIKAGDKVYLSYPAANRDPAVFVDPERFDVLRPDANKHLSFGIGPHFCLGARLARTQLKTLLTDIMERIPDIRMSQPPEFLRTIMFNAVINMPVVFSAESADG